MKKRGRVASNRIDGRGLRNEARGSCLAIEGGKTTTSADLGTEVKHCGMLPRSFSSKINECVKSDTGPGGLRVEGM